MTKLKLMRLGRGQAKLLGGLSSVALALSFSPAAQAQTGGTGTQTPESPAVAAAGQDTPAAGLEDIVVTAQKRSENVQNIPKSVQVITPEQLRQTNVTQISDLRNVAPSITGSGLSIRGVATSASNVGAQNKVGVVVDDVPQITLQTTLNQLVDVERVEVLPGPQGTLSGRNATGGLINVVTRGPSSTLTANGLVTATTDHQLTGSLFVAGPLTDTLSFSVSAYHDFYRGLAKNVTLDKWLSRVTDGVRGKLLWNPTSNLTLLGTVFHEQTISYGLGDPAAQIFEFAPPSTFFVLDFQHRPFSQLMPGVTPSARNNEYAGELLGRSKAYSTGGILKADYDLGPATLTYVGSHLNEARPVTASFVPVPLRFVGIPVGDGLAHAFQGVAYDTQELRVASPTNDQLNFIAGVIYTNNRNTYDYQRTLFGPVNWQRFFQTKAIAVYGHAAYDIVPAFTVAGGLRYESDKASYTWHFNIPDVRSANSNTDNYVNYDVSAQFRPAEHVMFYATYSKASQGRVFDAEDNIDAVKGPLTPLPAEQVKDIEAGVKSTFLDGRLRLNVNLFDGKYRNYQVSSIILDQTKANAVPTLLLSAVGRVETKGVEVSSTYAASHDLRLDLAAAYTDARIKDFPNAPCYTGQTAALGCVPIVTGSTQNVQRNLAGDVLASTPKWKIVTTATYTHPIGASDTNLELAGTVRYQSAQIKNVLQEPSSRLAPYTVVNLSAGLRTGHLSAQLFVNNLFKSGDLTYSNSAFLFASFGNEPSLRTHGLDRDVNRYGGVRLGFTF